MMKKSLTLILAGILCFMLAASGCTNSSPATPAVTATTPVVPLTQATTPAAPVPVAPSWTGTWNTTWLERDGNQTISVMTFTQTGTDVTGNYHYTYPGVGTYNGSLNATVQGNTLTGTYAETDNDVGLFVFKLSENRNSFTGRWVHAVNRSELDNSTLTWNGVRE
jgi:hypothetical protein